ncbi:MAG: hypothetical protein KJ674_05220 [Nanoarchaeota archaeon]|nr:hypothetical protein [Nanoarchaeota archaeon]
MIYKVVPGDLKVKAVTTIDFPLFYKKLKLWLQDEGYAKEKTLEQKYIERIKPNGKQLEIQWVTKKSKSDFFDYHIKLTFLILGMKDVEIQQGSITRKMNKGDFELRIEAYIETTKNLEKLGTLKRIYTNILIKKRIEEYKIELYDKVYKFHAYVKELLNLRNY